ncbi:MAG: type II toxin-antitoxin system RelE/ParE family toxin [Candidatus Sumerlaeota bacterium]|nr:type II toxin-antitoxin system RelE/ParE family toxin [Candidatus Sumerlaeota bacterium]
MGYSVTYKKSVRKDVARLGKDEARRLLDKVEANLPEKAATYPLLKGPYADLRKMRIGEYRVIFAILGQDALVLRIGHRRDVYDR